MGPQEWIDVKKYCKTLGTTPVPGVKVPNNQRIVFGHMTIDICILCFIETRISAKNKDNYTTFSGYDSWGIPITFMISDMGVNEPIIYYSTVM